MTRRFFVKPSAAASIKNYHSYQISVIPYFLHSLRISSGHILDCISPRCALCSSIKHRRLCPIPPPMLSGSSPANSRLWK